jgi:hypothetical protein
MAALFKLTLRDLLWLALLAASLTVGALQHQRSAGQVEKLKKDTFLRPRAAGPSDAAVQRRGALEKFAALSDAALDEQFAALAASGQWHHATDYEPCLTEMVRRGMVDSLQKHYDALMHSGSEPNHGFPKNLELLTALRRAQGRPDPLRIEVSLGGAAQLQINESAPAVRAAVTNVDAERQPVHFTRGGDYRGGRRERWRAVLTDSRGRRVRESNFMSFMGGGIASLGPFEFGASDQDGHAFDLRRYVAPTRSGKYQLQLVYHNEVDIASDPDLDGLIVTRSEPIDVVIRVPANGRRLSPGFQSLLAVLAASALLTAAIVASNRRRSPPTVLALRDMAWLCLLIAVAIGVWLDDRYWTQRIGDLTPDADASWSIGLAEVP